MGALAAFFVVLSACSALEEQSRAPASSVATSSALDTSGWSKEKFFAYFNALRGDAYPLDAVSRRLTKTDKVRCDPKALEVYRGTLVKLAPLSVHPALVPRIRRLERVARELGVDVYGRAPTRIRHFGGYACRRSTFRSERISEHALGNAIDVAAFDFPPLPKDATSAALDLPAPLRGPFQVTVQGHWVAKDGPSSALHQKFLRSLTERVADEAIFRVLLGPSHRGHQDHFHFDMSPWSYTHL